MASWDFSNDQETDSIPERQPKKRADGTPYYEDYKDSNGNWWTYGRRGWRELGDYDG